MSRPPETPRPLNRPSGASAGISTPPSRRRPALSPLSTVQGASPSQSFRSSTYPASVRAPESVAGYSVAPSRFTTTRVWSASASQADSSATAARSGSTRFRRGHVRHRPGQPPPPASALAVASGNPDDVDLMALEEPDDIFRAFGVRDVRRIEQRASEAAAAKVAELRTMVGERYRDLLSAADSIVRMRSAADKLVNHLDTVGHAVSAAGEEVNVSSSQRSKTLQSSRRRTGSPSRQRTLGSSATLSLTIHLLLSIPSLVHSLLETSDFLPAARLEDLGRLVYRELSDFELPPDDDRAEDHDDDEAAQSRKLTDAFPIVEKQWETLSALRPVVLRRALEELRAWGTGHLDTAKTLAAIVMLQEGSISSILTTLLDARSHALSALLEKPTTTSQAHDTSAVAHRLEQVLGLVLRTVDAVSAIFGGVDQPGLLQQLLVQVARPTAESADQAPGTQTELTPALASFPNYTTLQRHLPTSILTYSPPVAASASRAPLDAEDVGRQVDAWVARELDRVVDGVTSWIATLSSPATPGAVASAKPLAVLRTTLRRVTAADSSTSALPASASSRATAADIQIRLERVIESRLATVCRLRLSAMSARVGPALSALVLALPQSDADLDTAAFLFETPLTFPAAGAYVSVPAARTAAAHSLPGAQSGDPFQAFLGQVGKRVHGRAPLLDKGVAELEDAARELKLDLEGWLGPNEGSGAAQEQDETVAVRDEANELRQRLWAEYLAAVDEALKSVADAIGTVLSEVAQDVEGSLCVGNFVFLVASSPTFVHDLLLGTVPAAGPLLVTKWQSRLQILQDRSLIAWRTQAVTLAVRKVQESMSTAAAAAPSSTLWAWDASRNDLPGSPLVPSSPSLALLSALRSLSTSLSRVGLNRTQASPAIASSLLGAFADQVLEVAREFAEQLAAADLQDERKSEVASQAAWDLALLRRLCTSGGPGGGEAPTDERWRETEERFLILVSPASESTVDQLSASSLAYLQRTQSILAPLLSSTAVSHVPVNGAASGLTGTAPATDVASGVSKFKPLSSTARLLPLGPPLANPDVRASAIGLVKPGPRLGLLPTRG